MLIVDDVRLDYGASHALRGVSLAAQKGRVTCVLGRNGVGKTSLLRAILGLEAVRSGKIVWEGKELGGTAPYERARCGIGNVPQGREIFPRLSVVENLRTGFAAAPRDQRTIPEQVFQMFPVLKSMLNRRGGDLSGGQQQQLAFIPLVTNGKLIGKFMSYYDAAHVFTEAEVDLAVAIARQLGFGVERIRAEEALRESEARESARAAELRTIMEAVPAVIWIARDLECRVISGNQASHDFLRLSRETNPSLSATEDERPRNFEVLVGGRVLAPEELPVQRAARGEEIRNFEHETRFNDGTSRYLFGNATPLRDAEGNPCGAARVCGYYRSQESGRTAPVAHRGTEPSREEHAGHRHLDSAAIVLQKSKRR